MMEVAYVLVLTLLCSSVNAQIPSLGFCPDYIPMTNFDINRFLGKWYEAERYFTVSEVASRCVTTVYSKGPSGRIYVSNEITNRLTGIKRVIDGTLDMTGPTGEGKMSVRYNSFPPYDTSYIVLDTDYDSVAVIWSCTGIGPVHTQNAWVMTRERQPLSSVLQRAYGVLDKYKISRTFFLKTDQKDCSLGGVYEQMAATTEPPKEEEPEPSSEAKKQEKELDGSVDEHFLKAGQVTPEENSGKEANSVISEDVKSDIENNA